MAFQPGNKLASKARLFEHELNKAITQGDPDRLRRIAEKLLDKAEAGDLKAICELADRLDGKSIQAVQATVEHVVDVGTSFGERVAEVVGELTQPTVQ